MVAWFICPWKARSDTPFPARTCALNDFVRQIAADGGAARAHEFLGARFLCKVRASAATLQAIAGTQGFRRIPSSRLDDPLSSLTAGQRNALRNEVLDAGYTVEELNARFPNLAQATIGQVLRFLCTRRHRYRFEAGTYIYDGPAVACESFDVLDASVQDA